MSRVRRLVKAGILLTGIGMAGVLSLGTLQAAERHEASFQSPSGVQLIANEVLVKYKAPSGPNWMSTGRKLGSEE